MPNEKTRKLNPISAFFARHRKMKKKKQFFNRRIGKEKYKPFLSEVDRAVSDLVGDVPDTDLFLDRMGQETEHWLKDMPNINLASFKVGCCYGIFTYCRIKKETVGNKEIYVV